MDTPRYIVGKGYAVSDVPALQELNKICYEGIELPNEETFLNMLKMSDVWLLWQEGHWTKRHELINDQHCFMDVWVDTHVIGFCVCRPTGFTGNPYVWSVAVHPEYRRKGLATKLLVHVMGHYKAAGEERMSLHVNVENPAQIAYFKLGFRVAAIDRHHYGEKDGLRMKVKL